MSKNFYTPNPELVYCEYYDSRVERCQNCDFNSVDIVSAALFQELRGFYDVFLCLETTQKGGGLKPSTSLHDSSLRFLDVPYKVNGAFACELALKFLLIDSGIAFDKNIGHRLMDLYSLLPDLAKDEIKAKLDKNSFIDDVAFKNNLEQISNSFNDWRYMFQTITQNHFSSPFFQEFVHAVCNYVLNSVNTAC